MQNGEKIKDFIIHFHCLTVKVSQMGWISVKISGCDYNKSSVFLSGIKSSVPSLKTECKEKPTKQWWFTIFLKKK